MCVTKKPLLVLRHIPEDEIANNFRTEFLDMSHPAYVSKIIVARQLREGVSEEEPLRRSDTLVVVYMDDEEKLVRSTSILAAELTLQALLPKK